MSQTLPRHCVVDASVLVKYVVPETETPLVRRLLADLLSDEEAIISAPELLFIECANVLWKKVQRSEVDDVTAEESLADLMALEIDSTPIPVLSQLALRIACDHHISAYDACYLALAESLNVPLLTADERLVAAMAGTHFFVMSLTSMK